MSGLFSQVNIDCAITRIEQKLTHLIIANLNHFPELNAIESIKSQHSSQRMEVHERSTWPARSRQAPTRGFPAC